MKEKLTRLLAKRLFVCMLLCIYCLSGYQHTVCANNYRAGSQNILKTNVSLESSSATLKEVLNQLSGKSKVKFIYSENDIRGVVYDHLEFKDQPLDEVLEAILSPHKLTYTQMNDRVIVRQAQQPGGVRGKVYDAESGETLVGASIVVEGTTKGTTTDMDGKYTLSGLEPGTYNIVVSFVSYQKKKFTGIRVTSGNFTLLDVPLNPATEDIGEVEVVGRIDVKTAPIRNTDEVSLIQNIRTSDLMVTGISSEQISKSLDRDASDVVKRAPGVSMLNNFVLIRGMSPRYTQTYINGMQMSSTESFQRAFAFDLIPSGVIDAIDIYRMPAPELPGGFGGGIIKVRTKRSQTARRFQISLSGDLDTENSFKDLYTGSNDADNDWIGMGNDDRKFLPQLENLPPYDLYPAERLDQLKTMKPVNNLEKSHHSLNRSFGINYYDSWLIGGVRVNNLTSLNYTYKREANTNYRFYYSSLWADGTIEGGIERLDSISSEKVRLNALQSFNVVINDNHHVSFDFFANRNASDANSISHRATFGSAANRLSDSIPKDIQVQYSYKTNDLYSGQLSGTHKLGKHTFEWSYGLSKFESFVPDQEIFDFKYIKNAGQAGTEQAYQYHFPATSSGANSRSSYKIEEEGENAALNYVFTLNENSKLKAGGAYTRQDRTSVSSDYYWISHPSSGSADTYFYAPSPWLNLSELLGPDLYNMNAVAVKDFEEKLTDNNYRYDHEIWAAYMAWKQSFFNQKLDVYGGLRYEYEIAQLYDKNGDAVTEVRTNMNGETIIFDLEGPYQNHWLPSVNLAWHINEKQKLRAGYGKTIDRVFARERSLDYYRSVEDGKIYTGNQVLKNAKLDNADLRWEYYPSESEFIAAGLFYKRIKDPIENTESEGEKAIYVLAVNYKEAKLYGFEVEIRKNLGFIPLSWADRFSLIANISYTHTDITDSFFSKGSLIWTQEVQGDRSLTGSTPFLINANLYYTDPKFKTQVAVNYNRASETLCATGDKEFGYLYQDPYARLDFTLIQPLGKYFKLKAGVQNIFKDDITGWRDRDFDGEKRPGVPSSYEGVDVSDIGNAMRLSTIRKIFLGLTVSF